MLTLGIIGTGLIGGSIGMRARDSGWRVIGCDADPRAADEAVRCGAIDEAVSRDAVDARADVIAIAAHTNGTIAELRRMQEQPPRAARLIIDVASVKAPVAGAGRGVRNFVATHPMAGRERSGAAAATRDLFEGKPWLYVPSTDRELDARAVEFIGSLGGAPFEIDAEEHDRLVALTSHVPQVFATIVTRRLHAQAQALRSVAGIEAFMGPVARELTRLGGSSSPMWSQILEANREHISRELRALGNELLEAANGLDAGRNPYAQTAER